MSQQQKQSEQPASSAGGQLQVKASDEVLKGLYANLVQIGHTPEEFVLDFMNLFPPAGSLNARVILSPGHAKRFMAALADNIKKYEEQFGDIKPAEGPDHHVGFRTA